RSLGLAAAGRCGKRRAILRATSHVLLQAALAFAVSCAATPQDPAFPTLAADAPAGTGIVVPCSADGLVGPARCGTFRVWEDREGKQGRTIDLAFVVLEATDAAARAEDAVIL